MDLQPILIKEMLVVRTIFSLGEDALDNEYSVNIFLPSFLAVLSVDSLVNFRATNVTIPEYPIETVEQYYRGYKIETWSPVSNMEKTLSLSFKIDKFYRVYDILLEWLKQIVDPEVGSSAPDTDRSRGDIDASNMFTKTLGKGVRTTLQIVQDNVSGDRLSRGWTFYGVFPKKISSISLDGTSEGTPIKVDVDFSFLTMKRGL